MLGCATKIRATFFLAALGITVASWALLAHGQAKPLPDEAPAARAAHPREEHLLPLHVVAGAALDDRAEVVFEGTLLGAKGSAICFG